MYDNNDSETIHLLGSGFNGTYDGEVKKKWVKSSRAIWNGKPFYYLKMVICFLAFCISCFLLTGVLKKQREAKVLVGTFLSSPNLEFSDVVCAQKTTVFIFIMTAKNFQTNFVENNQDKEKSLVFVLIVCCFFS